MLLPAPLSGPGLSCGSCAGPLDDAATTVALGDLYFHAACTPNCEVCGCRLGPELEVDWSYQAHVVSSLVGYDRLPFHHVCAPCLEASLMDEPSAQD
ncbi:MAG: hypothetical protein HY690_03660 [Chloroflexi bacterium]|nr:hypothetical protein [Chloroflexota bacterium]